MEQHYTVMLRNLVRHLEIMAVGNLFQHFTKRTVNVEPHPRVRLEFCYTTLISPVGET